MRIPGPRTWRVRLLMAGVPLVIVGRVITLFPSARTPGEMVQNIGQWLALLGLIALVLSQLRENLRSKPTGRPNLGAWIYPVSLGATWVLIFLVTQGESAALGAHINRHGMLPSMEALVLATGLMYTLFYRPEVLHRELPVEFASEQALRLVPAGLAAGAAIVTGSYLLALHFFNEPLSRVPLGPLAVSIVAVMALLTPLYQLIARACWRYGLADVLDPAAWWAKSSEVVNEIGNYRHQPLPDTEKKRSANDKEDAHHG